jgi:hypothetical protein
VIGDADSAARNCTIRGTESSSSFQTYNQAMILAFRSPMDGATVVTTLFANLPRRVVEVVATRKVRQPGTQSHDGDN